MIIDEEEIESTFESILEKGFKKVGWFWGILLIIFSGGWGIILIYLIGKEE